MDEYLLDQFPNEKLTLEQEAALVEKKDFTALVMANMKEALKYTQRCCNDKIDTRTRISLCYQEMSMSAKRFRPGGIRFFAFAKAGLRGRMKTYWCSLNTVRNATNISSLDALNGGTDLHVTPRGTRFVVHSVSRKHTQGRLIGPDDDTEGSNREQYTGEIAYPETDLICARDQWEKIRTLLHDRLSDQQWMILDLVYKGGLNFPQIGNLLGLTKSAIHASHRNAILKLRAGVRANARLLL